MDCGIKVINYLLRDVFGIKEFIWFYSGRRGVHCWVSDEKIRNLKNDGRSAITDFISVYSGTETKDKKTNLSSFPHPSFQINSEIFKICEEYFLDLFVNDDGIIDLLNDKNYNTYVLSYIGIDSKYFF
jgi:DNA primase small subunit